ncbi:MAG: WbqC family protein [Chthoniobacterales bacterium]
MKVAIHQPQYLPWIPLIHKAFSSDIFVMLDTVQYQKGGVQNRNQIKTAQGSTWLTVPVQASLEKTIRETEIADVTWIKKHKATLSQNYAKSAGGAALDSLFPILELPFTNLAELNIALMKWMFSALQIPCQVIRTSQLNVNGKSTELICNICKAIDATAYISGSGAKAYLETDLLQNAGIDLIYHSVVVEEYPQQHMQHGFIPDLSAVDLILNLGPSAPDYIRGLKAVLN